jgi:hypothetical protein
MRGAHDYSLILSVFDEARAAGVEALVGAGLGLDLLSGERILAAAQLIERPKGHEHRVSLAITDRWTALSGWSSLTGPAARDHLRFAIPHAQLLSAEAHKAGFVDSAHIALRAFSGQTHKLEFAELQPQLAGFFAHLARAIPPHDRREALAPAVVTSVDDPIGVKHALAGLWFDDPQARHLLTELEAAVTRGMPEDVATDFVGRIVLAHRGIASGPCMCDGRWLSPLTAVDLAHAFTGLFGLPTYQDRPAPGVERLTVHFDPRRNGLDAAITTLGVASFMTLGVGFSPGAAVVNAIFSRPSTPTITLEVQQHGPTSAYRLYGASGGLESDALLAAKCHSALVASAYPLIAQRIAHGWQARPADLGRPSVAPSAQVSPHA